jgi:hypothetical protein
VRVTAKTAGWLKGMVPAWAQTLGLKAGETKGFILEEALSSQHSAVSPDSGS